MISLYRWFRLGLALGIGVSLLWALQSLLTLGPETLLVAHAQGAARYVTPTGADAGDCTNSAAACASVQYAVDQAHAGDEVRVAGGVYTGVQARGGFTQTVYLSKTLTVRGGYSPDFATWDPSAYTTTLDAAGQGRVFFISAITEVITPTLEGLRITGGNAAGLMGGSAGEDIGGGIFLGAVVGVISGCQIVDNVADWGGGVFAVGSQLSLLNSLFERNSAADGGALYLHTVYAALSSNSLRDNRASSEGGAIYATNKDYPDRFLWLFTSSVVSNSAGYRGGALYMDDGQLWLEGNVIQGNTTNSDGGGAYLTSVESNLTANVIRDGTANRHGGGLYLDAGTHLLSRNLVLSNTATSKGGGLYSRLDVSQLHNTVIADNQSGSNGSGMYVEGAAWQSFHTTFARNRGPHGLYVTSYLIGSTPWYANVALANAIVVSHTKGLEATAGNPIVVNGVLWFGNTTNTAGAATVTHAITGDPAFGADDYHITAGSAALDVALASTLAEDIDLDFRPQGYGPDLGADELAGVGLAIGKRASATLVNPGQVVSYTIAITSHGITTAAATNAAESEPAARFRDRISRDPALDAFFGDFLRARLPAARVSTPAATAVILTDTLPILQQALAIQTDRGTCTLVTGWGGRADCNLSDMAPGASARITLTAEVTATIPPTLPVIMRNMAQVAAAEASNWAYADVYLHNCHARLNNDSFVYTTVQAAVDAAVAPTDVVKVSGICWGTSVRNGVRQQVYLSRTLTLQGGWNADFTVLDSALYPTTLQADGQGRVLYVDRASPLIEGLRLTGGQDWAVGGGGAYLLYAGAVFSDCQVTGNGGLRGGGIGMDSSPAVIWGSVISANVARDPNPYDTVAGGWGGGLYLEDSDATLGNNIIADNQATAAGGGAHFYFSDATLVDNEITGNSAPESGGLYAYSHHAGVRGNTFRGNTSGTGAALHMKAGDSILTSNVISGNNSNGLLYETGNVVLADNLVANNTGIGAHIKESGASLSRNRILDNGSFGLHLEFSVGTLENTVVGNNANHGVVVQGSTARLAHNTIVRNGGAGVGVWATAQPATMTDTLVAGNATGVYVDAGATAALEGTLWGSGAWANETDWSGSGVIYHGAVSLWGDPAFLDPANRDYHIGLASAAVDAGVNAGVASDVDGQFRPMRFGFDIGADEVAGAGLALVKQSSHAVIGLGGSITYTLAITSSGTAGATQVRLTDTLPIEQQPAAFSADRGTCALVAGWGGGLTCDLGDMSVGASAHVTLTAQITTTAPVGSGAAWMRNAAEVRAAEAANAAHADVRLQTCVARVNGALPDYDDIQAAVDAAAAGDTVTIAGVCLGTHVVGGTRQTVRLDREVSLRGGFNQDFSTWAPAAHPTTLDAQSEGRTVYITGNISPTLESLRITGGNATALGGGPTGDAGGGVYVVTATVTISACTIYSNTASAANHGYGGGLYLAGSNATLSGNAVVSNTASATRYGYGGGLYLSGSAAALRDNTVEHNIAGRADQGYGGGAYLASSPASLNGNTVVSNTARLGSSTSSWGGGLYLKGSAATLSANTVMSNAAGYGGGVYLDASNGALLNGNTVASNTLSYRGGGVYASSSATTLSGNTVSGNTASDRGGGLYLASSSATVTSNTISSNRASGSSGRGGGTYLYGSAATLNGNNFSNNTAQDRGGGAYLDQSNATLTENELRNSVATYGAGVYIYSSGATLDRNTIEDGRATYGGGVYAYLGAPIARDNSVVGNTASQRGGGLYLSQTTATISGNVLKNNVAGTGWEGDGGGLYIIGGAPALSANVIVSNTASLDPDGDGRGGGLYVSAAGPLNLVNNVIAGNHATTEGSGLWFTGSSGSPKSASLLHTTIADNGSTGLGVYVGPYSTLAFTNTIVSGHTTAGVYVAAGGTARLEGTLWHGNAADTGGPGTIVTGAVNIYGDPAFADPLAHDYHLSSGSAARDQGIATGVADDLDGQARPNGVAADLGADEFYFAAPALSISRSGDDVLLAWTHNATFSSYQVWYSSAFYFTPGADCNAPPAGMACAARAAPTSSFTHTGAAADVANNYAYLLLGVEAGGARSDPSNRMGEFGFGLVPGAP